MPAFSRALNHDLRIPFIGPVPGCFQHGVVQGFLKLRCLIELERYSNYLLLS